MSKNSGAYFGIQVQAQFCDLVVPGQINLTSGRRAKRLHQYPTCGEVAQEDEMSSRLRLRHRVGVGKNETPATGFCEPSARAPDASVHL